MRFLFYLLKGKLMDIFRVVGAWAFTLDSGPSMIHVNRWMGRSSQPWMAWICLVWIFGELEQFGRIIPFWALCFFFVLLCFFIFYF